MSERRHPGGPIRQLSLQQSPDTSSRHPLKKQQSVDAVRLWSSASSNASDDNSLRVTASSMRTGGHFPQESVTVRSTSGLGAVIRTRSVKLAWTDKQIDNSKNRVEVVAKRCLGQRRPLTCKSHRSVAGNLPNISGSKDTILYTRQQLAERLRLAWREREQSKPNLDIFLAHTNVVESTGEDDPLALELPADTAKSQPQVAKDTSADGNSSLPTSRNNSQDLSCGMKRNQNNVKPFVYSSTTFGSSKNLPVQNNTVTPLIKSNQSAKSTGISVANGCTDFLLNKSDVEHPKQIENYERTVTTQNYSGDESNGNNQQTEFQREINVGGPIAKINFNVFPTSKAAFSLKSPLSAADAESKCLQNHENTERNALVKNSSNKFTVLLEHRVDKCPDKSNVIKEAIPTRIESPAIEGALGFHDTTGESHQGINWDDSNQNSKITVTVSSRKKAELSADYITPSSNVHIEFSANSCTEYQGDEDLEITSEETNENERNISSTHSFETVNNKVVPPSNNQVINSPEIMSATARRVNFRNSVNKTITGSFSSDVPPAPAVPSVTRSTAPTPLIRALSAPGRSILVQRNKNGTTVDPPSDVTDGEDGQESEVQARGGRKVMSAPTRRRLRTAGPRRAPRIRGEESSGEEAEGGTKQKQIPPRVGRRGLPRGAEIVTMVSLLSDGSDADGDTSTLPQPMHWLEERQKPAEQNQTEQIICLKKSPKSVSFQQPPCAVRATSTLSVTRRIRCAKERDSTATTAGNTSGNTMPKGSSREINRHKAIIVQHSKVEVTPPNHDDPLAGCNSELSPQNCAATPSLEERHASSAREDTPAMPSDVSSESPCTGLGTMVVQILRPEPKAITTPVGPQSAEPEFQSPKERECWQLYRRMLEKGVSVSYDTVLSFAVFKWTTNRA